MRTPVVVAAVGLLSGATGLYVAWTLTYPLNQWHHGLIMLAVSFTMFGYGLGAARRVKREARPFGCRGPLCETDETAGVRVSEKKPVTVQGYRRYQALTGSGREKSAKSFTLSELTGVKEELSLVQEYQALARRAHELDPLDPCYVAVSDEMAAVWLRFTEEERKEIRGK